MKFTPRSKALKILFFSSLLLGMNFEPYVVASPILNKVKNKIYNTSSSSFITKAVEKSGPSVVTIDTQRIVRNNNISNDNRLFLDPYFERIFGLRFP